MLIGFDSFVNKVIKAGGEKCKSVVYATYSDKLLLIIFLYTFYTSYSLNMVMYSGYPLLFLVIYILVTVFLFFLLFTRKAGFGMTDTRFVYVKFKHIGYKEREVYEILFKNVKRIDLRKIFGLTFVKMSFIDGTGRLKKIKFRYASVVLGMDHFKQKTNGKEIYEKLLELEKVLNRGDF